MNSAGKPAAITLAERRQGDGRLAAPARLASGYARKEAADM
jgi:hypothetical protein